MPHPTLWEARVNTEIYEYFVYSWFYVFLVRWIRTYDVLFAVGFFCSVVRNFYGCFVIFIDFVKIFSLEELSDHPRLIMGSA